MSKPSLSLRWIEQFKVGSPSNGLREPSGLVIAFDATGTPDGFWTVSDDSPTIYKLTLNGQLQHSFATPEKGLEGIALDRSDNTLLVVVEKTNEIIRINSQTEQVIERRRLADMAGYEGIADYFDNGSDNKGLEGIAWKSATAPIVVAKEGNPCLLLAIAPDLETILADRVLDVRNGFYSDQKKQKIDISDLCFDPTQEALWLVSDQGQCVFLYDWQTDQVIQRLPLELDKGGKGRRVEKAEGIALSPEGDRLYVVSDEESMLYVFQLEK